MGNRWIAIVGLMCWAATQAPAQTFERQVAQAGQLLSGDVQEFRRTAAARPPADPWDGSTELSEGRLSVQRGCPEGFCFTHEFAWTTLLLRDDVAVIEVQLDRRQKRFRLRLVAATDLGNPREVDTVRKLIGEKSILFALPQRFPESISWTDDGVAVLTHLAFMEMNRAEDCASFTLARMKGMVYLLK